MAEKQTDADKAAALKEYRDQQTAAVDRIAALRAARLARDLEAPPAAKSKKKVVAGKASPKAVVSKAVLLKAVASKLGATRPVAKPASKIASKKVAAKVTAKV